MEDKPKRKKVTIEEELNRQEKVKSLPDRLKELEQRDGPSLDGQIKE